MGRPKKQVDDVTLLKLRGEGKNLKEISEVMGVSSTTLSRHVALLHHEKGILTKYRQLQGLQLTELQARILAAVDLDHLEKASLVDIANALYVITKIEMAIKEKGSGKSKGILDHILALENDE
jgi:DNA-binding MarR family transcriptional regulator